MQQLNDYWQAVKYIQDNTGVLEINSSLRYDADMPIRDFILGLSFPEDNEQYGEDDELKDVVTFEGIIFPGENKSNYDVEQFYEFEGEIYQTTMEYIKEKNRGFIQPIARGLSVSSYAAQTAKCAVISEIKVESTEALSVFLSMFPSIIEGLPMRKDDIFVKLFPNEELSPEIESVFCKHHWFVYRFPDNATIVAKKI